MRGLALAGLLAFLSPSALAQPKPASPPASPQAAEPRREPDFAYGAYQRGLYNLALREATKRVDQSTDPAAMTLLGELHNQGLGVRQNPEKAAEWYRLAARQGDAHALSTLGLMSIEGRGVEQNRDQGRAWLEQAAAKGEPTASYNIALLLLPSSAEGDVRRGVELLRHAAENEIADAQHALGVVYLRGRGVPRDTAAAARWFRRAAENGNTAGEVEYAILLFNGEGVGADEALAARYFRRAAGRGNVIAQNRLARLYAVGRGVPKNLVEAGAWHLIATNRGLPDAWLDQALKAMSDEERSKAERLATLRADQI